ncbi:MAG: type IV pilus assembly protein PilM [Patescibacteria group bacterium]|jgi:type IV pilus assembly protein PilM
MGLLTKETNCLGIDLGSHNVKVVELKKEGGRPKLVTYGFSDRQIGENEPELISDLPACASVINEICRAAGATTRRAVFALPSAAVFSSVITLSGLDKASGTEIDAAVRHEAAKVIPLPLEQTTLHYYPINTGTPIPPNGHGQTKNYLLTAAPRELVAKYLELIKLCRLVNVGLETQSFALIRSLVGADKSAVMLLDIGEVSSGLVIVKDGIPIFKRNLDLGGHDFTRVFQTTLKVDWAAAEQFKRDLTSLPELQTSAPVRGLLENLAKEINYCFKLYFDKNGATGEKIEKIILTGGEAVLPQLDSYLSEMLKIRVFVGDPWARLLTPAELRPVLDRVGPKMAAAVGLALREMD